MFTELSVLSRWWTVITAMAAAVVIVHTAAVVEEEEEEAGMPADLAGMPAAEVVSGGAAGQGEPDTT